MEKLDYDFSKADKDSAMTYGVIATYADLSCDWEDSGYSEYLEQNNSFGEM